MCRREDYSQELVQNSDCKYSKEEIELKKKISPPDHDLTKSEWKHIFIQSYPKDRNLDRVLCSYTVSIGQSHYKNWDIYSIAIDVKFWLENVL